MALHGISVWLYANMFHCSLLLGEDISVCICLAILTALFDDEGIPYTLHCLFACNFSLCAVHISSGFIIGLEAVAHCSKLLPFFAYAPSPLYIVYLFFLVNYNHALILLSRNHLVVMSCCYIAICESFAYSLYSKLPVFH